MIKIVANFDINALRVIRESVNALVSSAGRKYDHHRLRVLEIGPTDALATHEHFRKAMIDTLDISPNVHPTYVGDITKDLSPLIPSEYYGLVICTEVLEHTTNPFEAVKQIHRILKPGGILLASAPFNFRIHGPAPDCWRFTEYGWRILLEKFDILELTAHGEEERPLAPVGYTIIAEKKR